MGCPQRRTLLRHVNPLGTADSTGSYSCAFGDSFSHRLGRSRSTKVERSPRRLLNALDNQAREAQTLHFAANRCGDATQTWDELGEIFGCERLVTIALGLLRRIVHFDHQRVRSGGDRGE